ncbi:alpha/beta fold hydrolase [Belnapia sp. T6]|uniref:Alpha/beta fold hydrolase n=1 Tax=Belnapia mucosa TaxID=2804532 RepID=A0ABS1UYB9_9PROT|nr:alpha/beta fold hydrolase [Belnapia mucosa]MBL6454464.1 alpha/beta fold hydrolase [Belnapia mucosa]
MTPLPRRIAFSARDGLRLSALEWAGDPSGTPLLCLPGIARTALDFTGIAMRHRGRRRVVALDYAGHGESGRAADPRRYRVEVAIRDLLDAMAALRLHRVALLGTSFGGVLGMALAVLRPTALAALALNDTGPRLEPVGLDYVRDFIGSDRSFADAAAAAEYLRGVLPPLGIPEAGWPALVGTTFARGADGRLHPRWDPRIVEAMPAETGPTELWPLFGALDRIPLLLVWGQASVVLSAATVARMRAERPDMPVVALPGIGHAPTLLEPPVLAALDRFLGAVP